MLRCVEYARRYGIPVHVRSSYSQLPGTIVTGSMEDLTVEQAIITGVAHDRSEGKITVYGVPDRPGEAAQIFRVLADAEINIDMIVQNVSAEASKLADISFTLPKSDGPTALAALERVKHTVGYTDVSFDQHIGKVSLVGAGMRSHPGVSAKFFGALADAGVNLELISTSEIRISVVCRDTDVDLAVRAVHDAFDLGSDRPRPWSTEGPDDDPPAAPGDRRRDRSGRRRDALDPGRAGLPAGLDPVLRLRPLGRQHAALG